jgi:hypothetical protein
VAPISTMMTEQGHTPTYRRIGTILVERGLISEHELSVALAEQERSGRPLGEVCVERFGLDRLHLADALASQWDEMKALPADDQPRVAAPGSGAVERSAATDEEELRVLLEEAQAARAELETKTDELSQRLAALEALVADVSTALAEIHPAERTSRVSRRKPRATPASKSGSAPATSAR